MHATCSNAGACSVRGKAWGPACAASCVDCSAVLITSAVAPASSSDALAVSKSSSVICSRVRSAWKQP